MDEKLMEKISNDTLLETSIKKEFYDFLNDKKYPSTESFSIFSETLNKFNENHEKDPLSIFFEKYADKNERKRYGQFFTHEKIVNLIFDNIPITKDSKILDPSCGTGAFIIEAIKRTKNANNVYGIDIDQRAINLCHLNVNMRCNNKISNGNFICKNTLKKKDLNAFDFDKYFNKIKSRGGFDIIVGNPPHQNLKKCIDYDPYDTVYRNVISGITNSSTLMIARSFELLKEEGYMAFVLPKNVLRVDSFDMLRNFLNENTKIISIFDLNHHFKDVRGDQIVIIIQKKKLNQREKEGHEVNIIPYRSSNLLLNTKFSYKINQKKFSSYSFYPVFYMKEIIPIADKLLSIKKTLFDICKGEIFRGISIGANHESIYKKKKENTEVCFRGDSIKRYGIKYNLYIDFKKIEKTNFSKIERLKREKIIAQNIFSKEGGVFATLDMNKNITLDTVTNIIPQEVDNKYILALLNSKISNFFMIFIIYLNSNFTMHTDASYIGKIPVVIPNKNIINNISELVENLLKEKNTYSKDFLTNYDKINQVIYSIYNLNKNEINIIEKSLYGVMSGKSNGRSNE